MTAHFIYHPRSGDRVFAHKTAHGIFVVKYDNGCRHVVGGVHVALCAGDRHTGAWRTDARALARATVDVAGGIAWDDRGDIHFIAPGDALWRVFPFWNALANRHGLPMTVLLDFVLHGTLPLPKDDFSPDPDPDPGIPDVTDGWPVDGRKTWRLAGAHWTTPSDWKDADDSAY